MSYHLFSFNFFYNTCENESQWRLIQGYLSPATTERLSETRVKAFNEDWRRCPYRYQVPQELNGLSSRMLIVFLILEKIRSSTELMKTSNATPNWKLCFRVMMNLWT